MAVIEARLAGEFPGIRFAGAYSPPFKEVFSEEENRVEIHASHPVEDRWILIGKKDDKLWTTIYTLRGNTIRIISVRRSREKEVDLYDRKVIRKE